MLNIIKLQNKKNEIDRYIQKTFDVKSFTIE